MMQFNEQAEFQAADSSVGNDLRKCEIKIANLTYIIQVNKKSEIGKTESLSGTEWYYAPEMVDQWFEYDEKDPSFKYTQKVDVWAIGAIFCQMITGFHPFYFC